VASAEARVAPEASQLLAASVHAAAIAAEIVQRGAASRSTLRWDEKGPADYVSDVDRASEDALRTALLAAVPHARVLGEERSPDTDSTTGVVFVVDPLDGTTNFLHGYPAYAVSIGALVDGVLTAAVVRHAVTGETFTAIAGGGAFRNGEPMHVSPITAPGRALIGTGFPFSHLERLGEYQPQFAAIARRTAGIRRAGSAALDLCDVACGRFDGFWELRLAPWDIAAGLLLVREAGGLVTDLAGVDAPVDHTAIVAGNPAIHAWLLDTLARAGSSPLGHVPPAPPIAPPPRVAPHVGA
jgi:myo-inositol-1(or 4)-monophosphatase